MKRAICLVICLLIPVYAFALSDIDIMVSGHNLYCSICGAMEIPEEPFSVDETKEHYTYRIAENLYDVFFVTDGSVTGFGCVCKDESKEIEFLAQCVTACYNFLGTKAGDTCYNVILSQFMFARGGNNLDITTAIPGLAVHISKESFGYVFTLTVGN